MPQLLPAQVAQFLKRFRFTGGRLRRFRIMNRSARHSTGEIVISVREGEAKVRLRLVFDAVEEYRFQRRPGPGLVRLKEVKIGSFDGLIYFNLDAYPDDAPPGIHDFRASDAFIGARILNWEIVPRRPKPPEKS